MNQYAVLAIVTDCALINIGLYLAAAVRFPDFRALNYFVHEPLVNLRVALVVATCVIVFYHSGLYDFRLMSKCRYGVRNEILARLLAASGIVLLTLAGVYFAVPALSIGRSAMLCAAPLVLLLTLGWRWMLAPSSPQLRF